MGWFSKLWLALRSKSEPVDEASSPAQHAIARDEDSGLTLEIASELADLAERSFDRQAELDDSVWRSLPFFAAVLAIAVTVLVKVADALPAFSSKSASLFANVAFWLAVVSLRGRCDGFGKSFARETMSIPRTTRR
jgi:hypothetical protein